MKPATTDPSRTWGRFSEPAPIIRAGAPERVPDEDRSGAEDDEGGDRGSHATTERGPRNHVSPSRALLGSPVTSSSGSSRSKASRPSLLPSHGRSSPRRAASRRRPRSCPVRARLVRSRRPQPSAQMSRPLTARVCSPCSGPLELDAESRSTRATAVSTSPTWARVERHIVGVHRPLGRSYLLFRATIERASAFHGQTPQLWWPDDRRWFVSTEIDGFFHLRRHQLRPRR